MYDFVTDELFDLEKTKEYILSIQVSLGGFSFSIIHPGENRLLVSKHTPLIISDERLIARRLKEWIDSEKLFLFDYAEVRIIIFTQNFTLVPERLFSIERTNDITNLLFEKVPDSKYETNYIDKFDIRLIFELPPFIESAAHNTFANHVFFHPVKLTLEKLPKLTGENKNGLVLVFDSKNFFLVLFNNHNLLLANSYRMTHPNDVVYYVLTSLRQTETNQGVTQLFIAGEIFQQEETERQLKEYFGTIEFFTLHPSIKYDPDLFSSSLLSSFSLLF